ncbi:RNA 2'-phosphotransferase, partial [Halorubrum sp. CBA1125]|uniref:RNA 2'-phosphotransferase n=1 Tax=Halorubrum sp. CBA1125 TaxID=2668072 RepID=UPI0012E93D87
MPSDVRTCDDHGFFAGESCPGCGADGRHLLDGRHRERLSKFLSGVLRHFPGDVGLTLDDRGWADFDALVDAATERYDWATREAVAGVVATDPNGRFERADDGRVRAAYGHSVDVTRDDGSGPVPDTLYHGTAPRDLDAIREEGLRPMSRQRVHLSESVEEAERVGRRHADDPVVLVV